MFVEGLEKLGSIQSEIPQSVNMSPFFHFKIMGLTGATDFISSTDTTKYSGVISPCPWGLNDKESDVSWRSHSDFSNSRRSDEPNPAYVYTNSWSSVARVIPTFEAYWGRKQNADSLNGPRVDNNVSGCRFKNQTVLQESLRAGIPIISSVVERPLNLYIMEDSLEKGLVESSWGKVFPGDIIIQSVIPKMGHKTAQYSEFAKMTIAKLESYLAAEPIDISHGAELGSIGQCNPIWENLAAAYYHVTKNPSMHTFIHNPWSTQIEPYRQSYLNVLFGQALNTLVEIRNYLYAQSGKRRIDAGFSTSPHFSSSINFLSSQEAEMIRAGKVALQPNSKNFVLLDGNSKGVTIDTRQKRLGLLLKEQATSVRFSEFVKRNEEELTKDLLL